MSLRQDLIDRGYDPDAPNSRGYVCRECGEKPTEIELDLGQCSFCAEERRLKREAVRAGDRNEYDYGRPDLRGYGEGTEP